MKFTKNRLLSLLLVLAMMLALVPTVFAARTLAFDSAEAISLQVGQSIALPRATCQDSEDTTVTHTVAVTIKPESGDAATIAGGKLTAVKPGTVTLLATCTTEGCSTTPVEKTVTVTKATITVPASIATFTKPTGSTKSEVEAKLNEALTAALTDSNTDKLDTSADWTVSPDFDSSKAGTFTFSKVITLSTENQAKYQINTADNTTATVTCTVNIAVAPNLGDITRKVNDGAYTDKAVIKKTATTNPSPVKLTAKVDPVADASLSYQWYASTATGEHNEVSDKITGATSEDYTLDPNTQLNKAGTYYFVCKVTATGTNTKLPTIKESAAFKVEVFEPFKVTVSPYNHPSTRYVGNTLYYTSTVYKYVEGSGYTPATMGADKDYTKVYFTYSYSGSLTPETTTYVTDNSFYVAITGVDNKSGTSLTVSATAYKGNDSLEANGGKGTSSAVTVYPASASPVTINPTSTTAALMDENTITSAVYSAIGSYYTNTVERVVFETSSTYGSFSTTGSSTYTYSQPAYVSSTSSYYTPKINSVYFVPSSSYVGFTNPNLAISYTAYGSNGKIVATGSIKFTTTSSITYNATASTPVYFKASDFTDYFKTALGGTYNSSYYTLSEVTFGTPRVSNSSVTSGTLYYNNGYVYSTTKVPAANLGYVSYTPSSSTYTYTVSIPFTAYGTYYYGSTATKTVSGTVTIKVNDGHVITMVGTDFKSASIWSDITSKHPGVSYVSFSQPQSTVGKLYYGYSSIASKGSLVSYTDRFNNSNYNYSYANTIKSIDGIYFVPAAGCLDTVTLTYTAYTSATATTGVSDTITFTITKKTASSIFNDVTASNTGKWSADAIDFLARNSIVEGGSYGTFNPNGNMTRGDFVLMLYRMAGKPSVSGISNPFTDVKSTDYYYNAILWAYRNDIVTGVDAKTFAPKKNITREQIAATLYRMAGSPSASGYLTGYYDYAKIHSYATNAMRWAISNGVITGSNGYLTPTNNATRAQVAAMLHRYLTK